MKYIPINLVEINMTAVEVVQNEEDANDIEDCDFKSAVSVGNRARMISGIMLLVKI